MSITANLIAPLNAAYTLGGFDIPMLPFNEANSATFKNGALLGISAASGTLVEATAALPTVQIAGIAQQAGTNNASAPVYPNYGLVYPAGASSGQASSVVGAALSVAPLLFVPALPHVVFEGTFANNGSDINIAAVNVFTKYGMTKDATSGFWYVDGNKTTTNASVLIIGIKNPQDLTLGTTKGGRVYFVFLAAQTMWGLAS